MFKENIKSLVIVVLTIALTAGVAMAYSGAAGIVVEGDLLYSATLDRMVGGVTAGIEYFQEGIVEGGLTLEKSASQTSGDTGTLSSTEVCQNKNIEYTYTSSTTAGIPTNTLYLPTSDKLIIGCLHTKNDMWRVYFSNENTAAATTTTLSITSGDTMELLEADGSDVIIPGAEDAIIEFRNAGGNVVKATVTSVRAAD